MLQLASHDKIHEEDYDEQYECEDAQGNDHVLEEGQLSIVTQLQSTALSLQLYGIQLFILADGLVTLCRLHRHRYVIIACFIGGWII